MIDRRRLAAPGEHLGVLIEPAAAAIRAMLTDAAPGDYDQIGILDATFAQLAADLRRRLGLQAPVIVAGHQVEFFHAGVFAKNIAIGALAARTGGRALFLAVDNDVLKTDRLVLPQITTGGLRRVDVVIPGADTGLPDEFQPPVPRRHWLDFFTRIASLLEHYDRSLLRDFADAWLATDETEVDYRQAMARARTAVENAVGSPGIIEIRVSRLCATPEFRAFAAHLILDAARFAQEYNEAQAAYRRRHSIRTAQRPVPPLRIGDGRIELPFWVSRAGESRRRLFVADAGRDVALFADEIAIGVLRRSEIDRVQPHARPWLIEEEGWRLRPRALTLSAFARLFLADLFVHGIGGAKYDELTEDFIRRFFGVSLRPMCCVSATLHLPLPVSRVPIDEVVAARRRSRDIRYNPQRYLRDVPDDLLGRREELIRRSTALRVERSSDRATRRLVFNEIRRTNELMLQSDPWRAAELDQRLQTIEEQRALERIALDREYFFALHEKSTMCELAETVRAALDVAE